VTSQRQSRQPVSGRGDENRSGRPDLPRKAFGQIPCVRPIAWLSAVRASCTASQTVAQASFGVPACRTRRVCTSSRSRPQFGSAALFSVAGVSSASKSPATGRACYGRPGAKAPWGLWYLDAWQHGQEGLTHLRRRAPSQLRAPVACFAECGLPQARAHWPPDAVSRTPEWWRSAPARVGAAPRRLHLLRPLSSEHCDRRRAAVPPHSPCRIGAAAKGPHKEGGAQDHNQQARLRSFLSRFAPAP